MVHGAPFYLPWYLGPSLPPFPVPWDGILQKEPMALNQWHAYFCLLYTIVLDVYVF
jgi:hypothetical protein